ncbi:hypothetical protein [Verrucomicrobium spinosum]|uniref:hypothetical protein n=1 Tax=Verrucomicrobium spinosum TaxID=2736 RepID=UPI0012E17C3A|nr:hypothetical protein [Verrucomicrobium spinosum]
MKDHLKHPSDMTQGVAMVCEVLEIAAEQLHSPEILVRWCKLWVAETIETGRVFIGKLEFYDQVLLLAFEIRVSGDRQAEAIHFQLIPPAPAGESTVVLPLGEVSMDRVGEVVEELLELLFGATGYKG